MLWLKPKPTPAAARWSPKGPRPVVGDYVRVVMASGDEHVRGWVFAIEPQAGEGAYFICDPSGPWIYNFDGLKVEVIAGDAMPFEVPAITEDGLKPGDPVRVFIRRRNQYEKAVFVAEVLGRRAVRYPGAGDSDYPAEDVLPLGRGRITAAQIREMRERMTVGAVQARKILTGRVLLEELDYAKDASDLKPILEVLIKDLYPDPER